MICTIIPQKVAGGIEAFAKTIESLHNRYCPDTVFEAELTYPSFCDVQAEAEKLEQQLKKNKFDLNDYLAQLKQIKKMGPISGILKMLPGIGDKLNNIKPLFSK